MSVTTPYEAQRRRVRLMEKIEALRGGVPVATARQSLSRSIGLTAETLANIRKGRLKNIYEDAKRKIDEAFIAIIQRQIRDLNHELAVAQVGRGDHPRLAAHAEASVRELERLIGEARAAGLLEAADPDREAVS